MKILHISTSDRGGAGIAAVRLHESLLKAGINSHLLTLNKSGTIIKNHTQLHPEDCTAFPSLYFFYFLIKNILKRIHCYNPLFTKYEHKYLKNQKKGFEKFSFPFSDFHLENHPLVKDADILHLHWVSDGMLDFKNFFSANKKKIVWTLHDMNTFTGGCHHADACMGYKVQCNDCPQLQNSNVHQVAKKMLALKFEALKNISDEQLKIVTPSIWLMEKSKSGSLLKRFSHEVIPNGLDEDIYFPKNKAESRRTLGLPLDKKIILFVAHHVTNPRKGIHFLREAVSELTATKNDFILCSVGSSNDDAGFGNDNIHLGYVNDEKKMSVIYAAADVFVLPSMAENFPNTIIESLFCGTPVVAFNVGGIREQINDSNGQLVEEINSSALRSAIEFCLYGNNFNGEEIASSAKSKYGSVDIARKYIHLYQSFPQ